MAISGCLALAVGRTGSDGEKQGEGFVGEGRAGGIVAHHALVVKTLRRELRHHREGTAQGNE